jgi:cytochrome c-type biogenesis protein CcsB
MEHEREGALMMDVLSDRLLVLTILAYITAMVGYAAEFSFGRRGAVARTAAVLHGSPVPAAGCDADDAAQAQVDRPTGVLEAARGAGGEPGTFAADRARIAGKAAVAVTVLGALTHAGALLTRGLAAHRVPWGNMYEFVLAVALVAVIAWLVLLFRRVIVRHTGLFVMLTVAVLLGVAGMRLYTPAGPLVPALNSYWLRIHVSAAVVASGLLLVGFLAATGYLLRSAFDRGRRSFPFSLADRLPAAETLDRLTFRIHVFAFPIWTFAIICGAIWAEAAWGRYWGWDPKEVWSFISWVIYAGYLHARSTPSVKPRTTALLAVAGWLTMMFNLYGVNLFIAGLHSYAGVK